MADRADIETLIARTASGDRVAFSALYAATSAKLFGVILRIVSTRSEAEETLQEVYVRVWHTAGRYDADCLSPMTWLITSARNAAIDRRRRTIHGIEAPLPDPLSDTAPGPEAQAIDASDRPRLTACFDELAPDRAGAMRRAYLEGKTYAELAAQYGVPLNTMRTWLRQSLLRLRECLAR
ncbi:sigma-70 family RNA polymerase sigma factor [Roseovarius aestuariivivens]|uniref:sigma-70 family RNA polymerase sigma factor n=1 Tax=Roseovarius aestuariivivens TaxID=1888910 RepID=UPI001081BA1A|nr:sigma-70 family RNA polymerase sigma factor [Roseovarius aestuariivivens]